MKLSDRAREHVEAYGVEPGQVGSVVKASRRAPADSPTPVQLNAPWGGAYSLHAGEFEAGPLNHPFVVLEGPEGTVRGVHVVPEGILSGSDYGHPMKMLRKLAPSTYGLGVSVWGNRAAMFDRETLPASPEFEGVEPDGPPPEGHVAAVQGTARRTRDGLVQVLLAFAVDATAVRKAVGLGE